jgi:hypothetical protein
MGFVAETLGVSCLHVFVRISIHGCEIEFHRLVLSVFQRAFLVLLRLRTRRSFRLGFMQVFWRERIGFNLL